MFCYDIGPCPRCGSPMTGRLKQGKEGQKYFMMGSPVIYTSDPGIYNCACAFCGVQWVGSGKMVKRSRAEIKKMQDDWDQYIDARPEYTRAEETEIAEELYSGLTKETKKSVEVPKQNLVKKALIGMIKQTNRQGKSLADDFFGLTNAHYYEWQDDMNKQEKQLAEESEENQYGNEE